MPHVKEHRKGHWGLVIWLVTGLLSALLVAVNWLGVAFIVFLVGFVWGTVKKQSHYRAARKMKRENDDET